MQVLNMGGATLGLKIPSEIFEQEIYDVAQAFFL
jgi:hypothetical protein